MQFWPNERADWTQWGRRPLDFPTISWLAAGGLALLGWVYLIVIQHPPPDFPRGGDAMARRALVRQNYRVYFQAVALAKSVVPGAQGMRWSHTVLDPQSLPGVLKHGLWYAQGFAEVPAPSGSFTRQQWRIFFTPGAEKPLYFQMGNLEFGDARAAAQAVNEQDEP